jgi:hypothetical protein
MSETMTLEDRVKVLESEVAELKRRAVPGPKNWLDRVVGSMEEHPGFHKVLRLGREFRETYRPDEAE